jgi:hypothetical protein
MDTEVEVAGVIKEEVDIEEDEDNQARTWSRPLLLL